MSIIKLAVCAMRDDIKETKMLLNICCGRGTEHIKDEGNNRENNTIVLYNIQHTIITIKTGDVVVSKTF